MSLLLQEPPMLIQRGLVRRCGGVLDALLCQQLAYWMDRATKHHGGHAWVYKTYEEWGDEVGVSAKTARGALDRLRKLGFVVGIQNPSDPRDRTLWWRVDVELIENDLGSPSAPEGSSPDAGGGQAAAGGSSNAGASGWGTETPAETPAESAGAQELFPVDGAEQAVDAAVLAILVGVPKANGAKVPTLEGVEKVRDRYRELDLVVVARELEFWATHGNGSGRTIKSVMGTFATFVKRAEEDRLRNVANGVHASQNGAGPVPSTGEASRQQGWERPNFT